MLQKLPKASVYEQFQGKTPKSIYRNISRNINPTKLRPPNTLRGWSVITPKVISKWLTSAILKIDMTSYFRHGWSDLNEIWQPGTE